MKHEPNDLLVFSQIADLIERLEAAGHDPEEIANALRLAAGMLLVDEDENEDEAV